MIFPYQKPVDHRYEPIVPVCLRSIDGAWVELIAFVDTGADYSVFDADIANVLGLTLKSGKRLLVTVGDGDTKPVYLHKVTVQFAEHIFGAQVAFSKSLGAGFNLVGRKSFFESFQFCFNDRKRFMLVTKL